MLGKSEDLLEFVADRLGHDFRYAIDSSKIKNELGWEAENNLSDTIQSTVDWYLENPQWLEAAQAVLTNASAS